MNYSMLYFLFLCFSGLLISSCNNDFTLNDPFLGTWTLDDISGGFSGDGYNPPFERLQLTDEEEFILLDDEGKELEKGVFMSTSEVKND